MVALAIMVSGNLIGPALALLWVGFTHTPWRNVGFVRPRSLPLSITVAIVAGVAFKLIMKSLVMPLFGAPPENPTYAYLAGNGAALPGALALVIVGGGFGEELIWRGVLFDRLHALVGCRPAATAAIVFVTSVLFGLAHIPDQGASGAQQAVITGMTFGTVYALTGCIWPVMLAHAAFDVAAVLLIYLRLEGPLAQVLFR